METKMIKVPFDVEMAKKITNKEIPGRIVTNDGQDARIICWDYKNLANEHIVAIVQSRNYESLFAFTDKGRNQANEKSGISPLELEIPEYLTYKDGDIIYCEVDNGGGDYCKWLSIVKEVDCILGQPYVVSYVDFNKDSSYKCGYLEFGCTSDNIGLIRLATYEEKIQFKIQLKLSNEAKAKEYLKRFFDGKNFPKVSNSEKIGKFEKRDKLMDKETKDYMNSKDLSGPRGSFRKGFCSGWKSALTLAKDLLKNSTSLPPEYSKLVDEHFDELI